MNSKHSNKTKIPSPYFVKSTHDYFYNALILKGVMYHNFYRPDDEAKAMKEAVDYYHGNYNVMSPKVLHKKQFLKKVLSICNNDVDRAVKYVKYVFDVLLIFWKNNIELQECGFIPENNEFTFDTLSELGRMQIESVEFLEKERDKKRI